MSCLICGATESLRAIEMSDGQRIWRCLDQKACRETRARQARQIFRRRSW